MSDKTRREFIRCGAILTAGFSSTPCIAKAQPEPASRLRFLVPVDYSPPSPEDAAYRKKLVKATLQYVEYFADGQNIAQWNKPFARIDLEKRVDRMVVDRRNKPRYFGSASLSNPVKASDQMYYVNYF